MRQRLAQLEQENAALKAEIAALRGETASPAEDTPPAPDPPKRGRRRAAQTAETPASDSVPDDVVR